jgi:hypothetical protein
MYVLEYYWYCIFVWLRALTEPDRHTRLPLVTNCSAERRATHKAMQSSHRSLPHLIQIQFLSQHCKRCVAVEVSWALDQQQSVAMMIQGSMVEISHTRPTQKYMPRTHACRNTEKQDAVRRRCSFESIRRTRESRENTVLSVDKLYTFPLRCMQHQTLCGCENKCILFRLKLNSSRNSSRSCSIQQSEQLDPLTFGWAFARHTENILAMWASSYLCA